MDSKPWDRLPGEGPKAYAAFLFYRDMPDKERSISNAIDRYYGTLPPNRKRSKMRQWLGWSATHAWQERLKAWQEEMAAAAAAAKIQEIVEMNRRHAREAMALQQKALERLRSLKPEELSPYDVLRFFVEAARLERTALGTPEQITEQRVKRRLEDYTDDELAAIAFGGG